GVGMIAGHEHLRNRFARKPWLALDPHGEQMAAKRAVREGWCHELAQMLDMIVGKAPAIAVDAPLIATARAGIAADQDDGTEQLRMLEAEQDRGARADAATHQHGPRNLEALHH